MFQVGCLQLLRKPDPAQQQHKSQKRLMESGEEVGDSQGQDRMRCQQAMPHAWRRIFSDCLALSTWLGMKPF